MSAQRVIKNVTYSAQAKKFELYLLSSTDWFLCSWMQADGKIFAVLIESDLCFLGEYSVFQWPSKICPKYVLYDGLGHRTPIPLTHER